jgi:lipopolysaccharide export system protein LptC
MSEVAVLERRKKQNWAAPGGFHDRLMTILKVALPALIGILLAYLAVAPLTRSQEISFILDKTKVDVASERMRVQTARYQGRDNRGRPFTISARSAVQATSRDPLVHISGTRADIMLDDGPAALDAETGQYNLETEQVAVVGPILVTAPDNYRLVTNDVTVDLDSRTMFSRGNVQGTMPLGTFSANRLRADLNLRTVTLDGAARLHIVQGALR